MGKLKKGALSRPETSDGRSCKKSMKPYKREGEDGTGGQRRGEKLLSRANLKGRGHERGLQKRGWGRLQKWGE